MSNRKDWLKKPLPLLNVMFVNIISKIDAYKTPYELSTSWIARLKLICQTFVDAYAGVTANRATEKQMGDWFEQLLNGEPKGEAAPAAPVFQPISLPDGAFIGLLDEFREMIKFFKANRAYTPADGENLMIVAPAGEERNVDLAEPELKPAIDLSGAVDVEYPKYEFGGLELQWRLAGTEMWQLADKSTEKVITFTPQGITTPAKIELRGVYLLKNQRVGKWSPIYTVTIS